MHASSCARQTAGTFAAANRAFEFHHARGRNATGPRTPIWRIITLTLCWSVHAPALLHAQTINFDDATDSALTRFNPLTVVGVAPKITFPDDGYGGKAYRMESPAPAVPDAGPARMFSYLSTAYSDFYAAVDVVSWDNELNQAFGLLFRAENIGLGQTTGYVLNYDPQQASGGRGQIQINLVEGESDNGTIGAANLSLQPGHRYRFVLTAVGPAFTARVYDWNDFTAPIALFKANDSTYPRGTVGLFNFYRGNAVADANAGRADTTFDNFTVALAPPSEISFPTIPHPIPGVPQVVKRTPVSFGNFQSATGGVTFTTLVSNPEVLKKATLLLGPNESRDFLIPQLPQPGITIGSEMTFRHGPLRSNEVYDAQILLEDSAGRRSTNSWTFDTFSEEFLDSPDVTVIEAEDYNFDGGKFIDNPPPSGTVSDVIVNGNGKGYFDLAGVPDIDFSDRSDRLGSGVAPEYRSNDFVGTQAGSSETGSDAEADPPVNDTIRRKYSALGLPEYQVRRTEGTEWLNYTRTFVPGSYRVYLRAAGRAPQIVNLERVTNDPTKPEQTTSTLGFFNVPSTGMIINYRYVPLVDALGNSAIVTFLGRETVRLLMAPPPQNATQNTLVLNYLLFVPAASVVLESALSVIGPYSADPSATFEFSNGLIRLPRPPETRFYRLRSSGKGNISGIQVQGTELIIRYSIPLAGNIF